MSHIDGKARESIESTPRGRYTPVLALSLFFICKYKNPWKSCPNFAGELTMSRKVDSQHSLGF